MSTTPQEQVNVQNILVQSLSVKTVYMTTCFTPGCDVLAKSLRTTSKHEKCKIFN